MAKKSLRVYWIKRGERSDDNRTIAYYVEKAGLRWTTIRKVLPHVCAALKVPYLGATPRSLLVHECCVVLRKRGFTVPPEYVAPWLRFK